MDMIGHDAPSEQAVADLVEMKNRALNDYRRLWISERQGATTAVERGVDCLTPTIHAGGEGVDHGFWEAAQRSEDNVLDAFGAVEMRKIAARMPAFVIVGHDNSFLQRA